MATMKLLRSRRKSSLLQPESKVLRTIQAPHHLKNEDGHWIVSSAAFKPSGSDKSCSVDLGQLLFADGLEEDALFPSMPRSVGLRSVLIKEITDIDLEVDHLPILSNWYHGGIGGVAFTQGKSRKLARASQPVIDIDQGLAHRIVEERAASA